MFFIYLFNLQNQADLKEAEEKTHMLTHAFILHTLIFQKCIGQDSSVILEAEPLLVTFHTAKEPIHACKWMLLEVFNPDKNPSVKELKNLLKYKARCILLK